jgi:glycosyltransferase involved in cell wall biosynthesis
MQPDICALLLGPYPGTATYSILKYFDFCRRQIPAALPKWSIAASTPGGIGNGTVTFHYAARLSAWWKTYIQWPDSLSTQRADVFHIVDQGLAWYARFLPVGKYLITVHDLIAYLTDCGDLHLANAPARRRVLIRECGRQIRRMDHVISPSQYTADCVMRNLDIPARRITVIPNYADPEFHPLSSAERARARLRWFGDAEYAIIHVGIATSYKNRIGALKAFSLLHSDLPGARMFLVHGPANSEERRFLNESGIQTAVKFMPPLDLPHLREFYGAADVLVFPSVVEGFGWPVLDAMCCGCPVVTTRAGSLPEVAGDSALIVNNPHDHPALARALHTIVTETRMAEQLRTSGFERAKYFAPARSLSLISEVYSSLVRV